MRAVFRIIEAELLKLKRYHIVWAGVLLMLFSVLLTLFSSTAEDGVEWTFPFLIEQVLKNNITMIFPMCITLIAGYIIAREEKDDTLKSILTVPMSYRSLLCGKLAACGVLSLFLGATSAAFTVLAEFVAGFPGFSLPLVLQAFVQITANCLFLYIAVLPVIAVSGRIPGGHMAGAVIAFVYGYGGMFAAGSAKAADIYPITASMGLIGYRSYDSAVHWNTPLCVASLCGMILITIVILLSVRTQEVKRKGEKKEQTRF